jgi:hypothetical protein
MSAKAPTTGEAAGQLLTGLVGGAIRGLRNASAEMAGATLRPLAEDITKRLVAAESLVWDDLSQADREVWQKRGMIAAMAAVNYAAKAVRGSRG